MWFHYERVYRHMGYQVRSTVSLIVCREPLLSVPFLVVGSSGYRGIIPTSVVTEGRSPPNPLLDPSSTGISNSLSSPPETDHDGLTSQLGLKRVKSPSLPFFSINRTTVDCGLSPSTPPFPRRDVSVLLTSSRPLPFYLGRNPGHRTPPESQVPKGPYQQKSPPTNES